jgi:MFS family permease
MASGFPLVPLDWLNFFLADLRGGLGPYVGVFLLTQAGWNQAMIGAVLTISGIIGITLHTPIGALIDATHFKRGLIVFGTIALAASALAIAWTPTIPVVLTADVAMAIVGAIFAPTVAAITLGITSTPELPKRLSRNVAFDRTGNIFIALAAGWIGWAFSQRAVFYLVPLFAVLTTVAVLSIPARSIDHERARALAEDSATTPRGRPMGWHVLLERQPLLVLAAANALFHFANAPMLPLLTQKLAVAHPGQEIPWTSACIVTAQLATIPTALFVGLKANVWGRKIFLLMAFAALPLRGLLYTLSNDPVWLVSVQVFDGIAAGSLDALLPLIIADIMRGTGRYNVSRGVVGTIQGIAGSLSNVVAGLLVVNIGYSGSFLFLSSVAAIACLLVLTKMPETSPWLERAVGNRIEG